jgi:hypothetical protein
VIASKPPGRPKHEDHHTGRLAIALTSGAAVAQKPDLWWSKAHGAAYDGFLLSTANAFPAQLASVLEHLQHGRVAEAERCSAVISAAVADAFAAVGEVRQGNAFTNANKALAHIMAYGRDALEAPPPRLYAGSYLPHSVLKVVMTSLMHHGLLPERGYFENLR